MRISLLIHNVYGIGGTNRTVINLAEALSERHEVEIVSVFRRLDETMFGISPKVAVRSLVDLRRGRPDTRHALGREPSPVVPRTEEFARQYTRLTDQRIADHLRRTRADVVIGTRPAINLCVARFAPDSVVRIAQEHMTHEMVHPEIRAAMREAYPRIDAAVTVTRADAEDFARTTPIPGLRLLAIPNSVPAPRLRAERPEGPLVVAAGRLTEIKRYDVLLHAFREVADVIVDARLRIYGDGPMHGQLLSLVQRLGLYNNVELMGHVPDMTAEWPKAAVAVSTSDKESFGMTLVEAMRCGVPVVSTACPYGPSEIVESGVDGVLVPVGSAVSVAEALIGLLGDPGRRSDMARAARHNAERFDPSRIAAQYEGLIAELDRGRRRPAGLRLAVPGLPFTRLVGKLARSLPGRRAGDADEIVADCRAASTGAVEVIVPDARMPLVGGSLVCHERLDKADEHLVKVPFVRQADAGSWVAVVSADPDGVTEGRWNLYLAVPGRSLVRLRPGRLDLTDLVSVSRATAEPGVVRRLPYRTRDGLLSIRSWVRPRSAEALTIDYDAASFRVRVRVNGDQPSAATARLLLRRRDPKPVDLFFDDGALDEASLTFALPLAPIIRRRLTRYDDWDAFLDLGDGEPVRIARLLDDVAEKKRIFAYPSYQVVDEVSADVVDEYPAPTTTVTPYFTIDGNLSFAVADR